MTRTPLSRSKGQRSRSPGRFTHRRVGASGSCSCSGGRGNVLAVRNCCCVAVYSAARGASVPTGEERGGAYRGGRPPTACFVFGKRKTAHFIPTGEKRHCICCECIAAASIDNVQRTEYLFSVDRWQAVSRKAVSRTRSRKPPGASLLEISLLRVELSGQ